MAVLAFGLIACLPQIGKAEPMGTGFTYQGRLIDSNEPADGLYDFQFKLFSYPYSGGIGHPPLGTTDINEVDVIDGHFTVELDFGADVFNGSARWLQIGVRPGELNDPNEYAILTPRQELTPTPYALYAKTVGADADGDWMIDGDDMYSIPSGNVGIGTTSLDHKLSVVASEPGGTAVYGQASATGDVNSYGGYFESLGKYGVGVYARGVSIGLEASGSDSGVMAYSSADESRCGYFEARGNYSTGVIGEATGDPGTGVSGKASGYGVLGVGVGNSGVGVKGKAIAYGDVENYGGYFVANGNSGRGVYGEATGNSGVGVYGKASNAESYINRGGYFEATGDFGQGVYGSAWGSNGVGVSGCALNSGNITNYGGSFLAYGQKGRGVYGEAPASGDANNYGGYFVARGKSGRGLYAYAPGSNGIAVDGSGEAFDFYASGPGTNYGSPSSIRWKNDIQPIDDPLKKVLRLRGVYFNWDAEHGGQRDVGMIAEEVGEVLPEVVQYEEDGKYTSGMDYSKLTPLLVEAVKALKNESDEREKKLAEKDTEIGELKARLVALEASVANLTVSKEGAGL